MAPEIATLEAGNVLSEAVIRECLTTFPLLRMRVTGECMRPALRPGQSVRIAATAERPPRLGDVVLLLSSEGLRLHRLVWGPPLARVGSGWRTMGDRSRHWDAPLSRNRVLGTVVGVDGRRCASVTRALISLLCGLARRLRGPGG